MKEELLIPKCVGIIMDGNRRWAKEAGLPAFMGHKKGYEVCKEVIRMVHDEGIPHLVIYAFSIENWQRVKEETSFLMGLLKSAALEYFSHNLSELKKVRFRFVGDPSYLNEGIQNVIKKIEKQSAEAEYELTVWVLLSYSGRAEVLSAVNKAIAAGKEVDELSFSKLLWSNEMPDPDMIIRTGGEYRLSNFLIWQSIYSELFFTKTYWPAFTKDEFQSILKDYGNRERRIGK